MNRSITEIDYFSTSQEEFASIYEEGNIPVCIKNITLSWLNQEEWTIKGFERRYGDVTWRFSDTNAGHVKLSAYIQYMRETLDDSPLAIYDSLFAEARMMNLLDEYSIPTIFTSDSFTLYDSALNRPPYRWILIGPERSGTGMHIDPLYTNAWVTLTEGLKRWILFPPHTPLHLICLFEKHHSKLSSIYWYLDYYHKVNSKEWPKEYEPIEVLQYPGNILKVKI